MKVHTNWSKKIIAAVLAVLLALTFLPFSSLNTVRAADEIPSGQDDPNVPNPTTTKTVSDEDGDGVYTVQLDIAGQSVEETTQTGANVLIVLDRTPSMDWTMNGTSHDNDNVYPPGDPQRWSVAIPAINNLITTVMGENNANDIDFAFLSFHNQTDRTGNQGETFNYNYWINGNDSGQLAGFRSYINGLKLPPISPKDNVSQAEAQWYWGTNWQDPIYSAKQVLRDREGASHTGPGIGRDDDPTYVIFVTDGEPNVYGTNGHENNYPGNSTEALRRAQQEAAGIAEMANVFFYGVYVGGSSGLTNLQSLVSSAGGETTINGNDAQALEAAFSQIASTIVDSLGSTNVSVDDGAPALANVSTETTGNVGGFHYYKGTKNEDGTISYEPWTGEDVPQATVDENNNVIWDLSEVGTVDENSFFRLTFDMWPSQDAYDLIADLNNGVKTMTPAELEAAGIAVNEGVYTLKTNTHLNTTYTFNGENYSDSPKELPQGAMSLPTETIRVKKVWNNKLDQHIGETVKLEVTKDGKPYLTGEHAVEVSESTGWTSAPIYISMGQIRKTGNTYEILEDGHDYEVLEPEVFSYRWELTSEVYHPMVINGTPTVLIQDDAAAGTEGTNYYKINDKKYKVASDDNAVLTATNDRRSWLQVEKKITGQGAPTDKLFEYSITIEDPNDDDIWFSAFDPALSEAENPVKDLETTATAEEGNTGYYYAASGSEFTVKIKAGWTLRFTNLRTGTTYSIEETDAGMPDGFAFDKAESRVVSDATEEAHQDDPEKATISGKKATGTINVPNAEFYVDYTNKYETTSISVTKKWDDGNNSDKIRPSAEEFSRYISLLVKGTASTAYDANRSITDNGNNTYTITYTGLPKYIQNAKAAYKVGEQGTLPAGYIVTGENSAADGETITNYHVSTKTSITATKVWDDNNNKYGKRNDVTFVLKAGETVVGEKTIKKDATGDALKVTWTDLPISDENGNTIDYTVVEKGGENGKITMNGADYTVKVEGDAKDGFTITNTLKTVSVDPPVQKIIKGNDKLYNKGDFTFKIENVSAPEGVNAPMPDATSITNSKMWEKDGKPGFYEFGDIVFTQPGSYTYKVTESGNVKGVTNDPDAEKGKMITFTVTADEEGNLSVSPKTDEAQFTFTNTYTGAPETGDHSVMSFWMIAMIIAGLGIIGLTVFRLRKKENEGK